MAINNPIPSRVLTGVASLIESYGQDPDSIAEGVGITAAALYQPDIMISAIAINDLLEQAALVCNDRFFCLRLAPLQSWKVLGPSIWRLMSKAGNVGEMLQILSDNLERHSDAMSNYLHWDDSGGAVLSIEIRSLAVSCKPLHSNRAQAIELSLGVTCFELRRVIGNSWCPSYAQLRCAAPEDQAPLRQVFGNKIYFNQDIDGIYLSKQDLAWPLGNAFYDSAKPVAPELQGSEPCSLPFALQVDRIIRMRINSEGCSANDVATALGINQRTMQYRLQQHHSSYQKIYDATRLDLARQYLKNSDLSIAAVAERLRFTDSAAFSRFFKDKVGHSPRNYAKRARSGDTNIADS